MNNRAAHEVGHDDEDDTGEVIIDEDDIIQEVALDNEDLPDADDEQADSGSDVDDGPDDSVHIFTGHRDELYDVTCSPTDPSLVATGGGDDRGFLWRIGQGDWAHELQGHEESVASLDFSKDGQLLASGSLDGIVQIWDSSGNLKHKLEGPGGGIEWLRWHPRGHVVLAGSEDGTAWMWNGDTGVYLQMYAGHAASVSCGDFTPDGKLICTGSDDASLRIWDPVSAACKHVVTGYPYHTEGLTCLTLATVGKSTLCVTGSKDGSVHIVNIESGKVISSLVSHEESIECVAFDSSGAWVATGSVDQKLIIWDVQHSIPRNICNHEDVVSCLIWLGRSRYVATGCLDGKVRIWNCLTGECVRTFNGHAGPVQSVSLSSNLEYLVSVSLDNTARVFEIAAFV